MDIFLAVLSFILALIFFLQKLGTQKHLKQLQSTAKQKIGEILSIYEETKKELGELGKDNAVEEELAVKGRAYTNIPLMSPLGHRECLYYSYIVTETHQEHYTERDSKGQVHRRTRTVTNVLEQGDNSTRFWLEDETGKILVDPKDGKFDGVIRSVDRSERHSVETISYIEEIIGFALPITVIGTLCDKMGDLMIENVKTTPVIVSTFSQEEMIVRTQSRLGWLSVGISICLLIEAGVLFYWIANLP